MIINKKSWHFRYLRKLQSFDYNDDPRSLCQYFWRVVWLTLLAILCVSAMAFFISIVPILFWSFFHNGSKQSGFALTVLLLLVVCLSLLYLFSKLQEWMDVSSSKGASFTKVFFGTLKAAKNKVCPLIEYKD